jgi:NTP pyrophosphatase (non-canonical NTP hydrolase)
MSLRQLTSWAEGQARRLAANFGLDPAAGGDNAYFALAQTVKLGEEVGELHAEVLGALRYHRSDKAGQYGAETLGGELADVMVCLALLAQILKVDLAGAVTAKIKHLEARNGRTALNS